MLVIALYVGLVLAVAGVASLGVHAVVLYKRALDLNPLFEKKEGLKAEIEALDKKLTDNQTELKNLHQQVAVAEQIIAKGEAERQWLQDNEPMINNSKASVGQANLELASITKQTQAEQQKLDNVLKEVQKVQGNLFGIQNDIARLEATKKALEGDVHTLKLQKDACIQQEQQASKDLLKAQNDLTVVQTKLDALNKQVNDLQKNYANKIISLKQDYEKDREQLKNQFDAKKQSVDSAIGALNQLYQKHFADLSAQCEKEKGFIQKQLSDKRQAVQNAMGALDKDYQKREDELQSQLEAQKESVQKQCDKIETEYAKKQEKLEASFKAKHSDLEQSFVKHSSSLEAQLKSKEESTQKALSQFDAQLAQKAKDLEDKRKELEVAKASYDVLSQKNIDLQGENHDLEVAINMRRPNANQWGDLERPVFAYKSREKVVANTASEADWLKAFQAQLKNHGIIFSERMIYAFHTGMKVADLSPLVVLAGISGTGKSLLPQLYARAIGMNFVQLAVQPRWDSPQDMLGFFNYTENRFKATELSRLLWQYDRWNNKAPEVPKDDASMPMNLVLLDEMNLARVEYYFSDLLSKLEVRRTIDPNDASSRRAAEIEIECGATKDNADTRRLFVAPNTLFVGTMNEDESTQTLSDKVMDRANVLRFGRPNNLDAKPDTQGFMSACGHKRITLAQWNDHWKKDVEAATGVRIGNTPLTKYMEGINNILATIDRPFAHRVWQAMRLYVANYPDTSAEGIKHAVADQIELKIMPKLNGLQTQANAVSDAFGKLKNQLEVLGDDALTEAFEKAKGGNDIFFKWHGVTR